MEAIKFLPNVTLPWKGIPMQRTRKTKRVDEKGEEKNALKYCDSPLSGPANQRWVRVHDAYPDWLISL